MNEMTSGHIVKAYSAELDHLNELVLDMGNLGQDQLRRAVQTLKDEDPKAAGQVIDRDRKLNDIDIQADEEIIRLIAKRQPMAKDLRDILTVQKTISDLERVGDEARKIANLTIHFYDNGKNPPSKEILHDIYDMSEFVDEMLGLSLVAFTELDLDKALEVIEMDKKLYEDFRGSLRRLSTFIMEDSRNVGSVVDIVLALRALERIGGHAKNIGGFVIFLVTGKDVRHEDIQAISAEIEANRVAE
ncbi:MAG: phosphate signaling complex protein PhoU [Candidatus Thiodiazotropha lotti]|uniref:Phosphate-specific transport system accessory protein PhoU n=1 Tax=Candidatus Thiodiazotropha lotti TaxID=2792787 RepID=A0A9E4K7F5_9GAMM|nr:phosphate signaling complex protein PhoU [Candidatus Thiodiazotropha lotti]MCG7919926.1 phosphate signaling complex protein PhoU [Candidatus Thiodiazotropha lotti]MCG7940528.1 phosphate signaling complex protein PhoU [Candidatus Thiodiazotropha lotti]MCG7986669.1 phosphate signaling complex protein PhoU [Candidatus Thiodiazotropha lotti]MCG8001877.1 phosphate signaling complex protein PhoU [Candidatus Thiodiazotropha lotti]